MPFIGKVVINHSNGNKGEKHGISTNSQQLQTNVNGVTWNLSGEKIENKTVWVVLSSEEVVYSGERYRNLTERQLENGVLELKKMKG